MIKQAMDVERLVTWALLDQGLGWSTGTGDSMSSYATYGTRIDTSSIGAPSASLQSDDDALVVQAAIERLPSEAMILVVNYGRIGERPDWCPEGVGDYVQKLDNRDRPMWMYEKPGDKRSPRLPLKEWQGWRQEHVDYFRAAYTLWRQSLVDLAKQLNTSMATHEALPPSAPIRPWDKPQPVILTPDGPLVRNRQTIARPENREEFIEKDGELIPRY